MPLKYRYLIVLVLVIILGLSAYAYYAPRSLDSPDASDMEPGQEDWIRGKGRINILLLGTDEDIGTDSRTDTIILASLDRENNKISLLSIPRDTRVNIPGFGENKINSANLLGGVDLVKESISNLIKVPIDFYVLTNFEGFKGIVDTLGGVEIDVEQNMKYRVYDGMIDLKKGLQRLDGEKALQYVRFRHDKLGDISRTQRQQKFLTALAKEMMQAKNIVKLPVLIPKLNEAVKTDLSITQMVGLAQEFGNYDLSSITVQTLPGNFVNINGGSYWYVDEEKAHQMVLEVFAGKSGEIIDNNINVTTEGSTSSNKKVNNNSSGKSSVEKAPPKETVDDIPDVTLPPEEDKKDNIIDDSSTPKDGKDGKDDSEIGDSPPPEDGKDGKDDSEIGDSLPSEDGQDGSIIDNVPEKESNEQNQIPQEEQEEPADNQVPEEITAN
ncbi:MAG: LCP family protein [Dehalobacterium sp.]